VLTLPVYWLPHHQPNRQVVPAGLTVLA